MKANKISNPYRKGNQYARKMQMRLSTAVMPDRKEN